MALLEEGICRPEQSPIKRLAYDLIPLLRAFFDTLAECFRVLEFIQA